MRMREHGETSAVLCAHSNEAMRSFFIVFALFLAVTGTVAASSCSTTPTPNHVKLECRIASRESGQCYHYEEDGRRVNVCDDRAPCLAWTGTQLEISCGDEFVDTSLNLFRGNSTQGSTQGAHNVSWPFAVSSSVEGVYECREDSSDSLVANRSVIVDGESFHVQHYNNPSHAHSMER